MLISTKGRYALRVLIDLAEQPLDTFVPLKEIAQRQNISEKYLESILRILVRANVLTGLRGKGGGYCYTNPPETYTIGDILALTEDSLAPVACLEGEGCDCQRQEDCRTVDFWIGLDKVIQDYLHNATIVDLTKKSDNCPLL